MKRKGFTLVELLAVITLLGLIALIVVPAVDRVIRDSKTKMYEKQKQAILTAMQEWTIDNKELFSNNNIISMTLNDLKDQNYLDYDLRNPATGKCINGNLNLTITKIGKKFQYSILRDKLVDGTEKDCESAKKYPSIYLLGNSVHNVEINTNYVDPGYSAISPNGTNITSNVTFSGIESTDALKTFVIKYSVTSNGLTRSVKRTVNVVDTTAPVLTVPDDILLEVDVDSFDVRSGVSVTDNSGETIDVKIISDLALGTPGRYAIYYVATDSSGNTTRIKRNVTIDRKKACRVTSGNGTNVGDEITCETESFYVYDVSEDNIKMIAKYNLKVGGVYNISTFIYTPYNESEMTYMQDSRMKGYVQGQAANYGTTEFASNKQKGENYSSYIGSLVQKYVNKYRDRLKKIDVNVVDASLITIEELETLGCSLSDYTCSSAPDFVKNTTYWSASADTPYDIWQIYNSGRLSNDFYDDYSAFGVRPVITISKSDIQ